MRKNIALCCCTALLAALTAASADEIELFDGRKFEGRIQSESSSQVVFQVHRYGMTAEMTFPRSQVRSLVRKPFEPQAKSSTTPAAPAATPAATPDSAPPSAQSPDAGGETARATPLYFVVPLRGVVGREILADKLKEALQVGLRDKDTVLILEVDSPGGMISECEKIVKLLSEYREYRSIAHIKSAFSAAAIISLTCDEIYMQPTASIGAALAFQDSPWGRTAVDEKFQSVWRSICRMAADVGKHNPLLAEAMVDRGMQLRLVQKDGKPDVEQFLRLSEEDVRNGKVLTTSGKLLTMTSKEAIGCGLADGEADTAEQLLATAKLADRKAGSPVGKTIMESFEKEVKDIDEKVNELRREAEKALQLAFASDPESGHYMTDMNGRFTSESRREWMRRSAKCFEYLGQCEDRLDKIATLCQKVPIMEGHADWAKEAKSSISAKRQAIKENAKRKGL